MSEIDKKAIRKAAKALYDWDRGPFWPRWKDAEGRDEYVEMAEVVVKEYLKNAPVTFQYIKPNWYNPDE